MLAIRPDTGRAYHRKFVMEGMRFCNDSHSNRANQLQIFRTATVKHAAQLPAALAFASQVAAYLNKSCSLKIY